MSTGIWKPKSWKKNLFGPMNNPLAFVLFRKTAPLTSIQDLGRKGMAAYGVPYSGAMDWFALRMANHLLRNHENAAALEMAMPGTEMVFEAHTELVFTGAIAEVLKNGEPTKPGKIINIKEGDQIKVSRFIQGQWLYMGIYGGFESRLVLGSRSFYPEITEKKQLIKGDHLPYKMVSHAPTNIFSSLKTNAKRWESPFVSAYPGPEWKYLNDSQKMWLSEKTFTLSEEINRMAYQLSEKLNNDLPSILTAPVYPGTVQLTPSGKLIILMRDAQVTGGYPRILQIDPESMDNLAQKRPRDKVKFNLLIS